MKKINKLALLSIFFIGKEYNAHGHSSSHSSRSTNNSKHIVPGGNRGIQLTATSIQGPMLTTINQTNPVTQNNQQQLVGVNGITGQYIQSQGIQTTNLTNNQINAVNPQPQTQLQIATKQIFNEEKHLKTKIAQAQEYYNLQNVAIEILNAFDVFKNNKNSQDVNNSVQRNINNPNTIFNKLVPVLHPEISNAGGIGYYLKSNSKKDTQKNKIDAQKTRDFIKNYGLWEGINGKDWTQQSTFTQFQKECEEIFKLFKKYLNLDRTSLNKITSDKKYFENDLSSFCEQIYNNLFKAILSNESFGISYYAEGTLNLLINAKNQPNVNNSGRAVILMNQFIYQNIKDINSPEIKSRLQEYYGITS